MLLRPARSVDLPDIVALLMDDALGAARESAGLAAYQSAFARIAASADQHLIVGESLGRIIATCQLTLIAGLSRGGMTRALIEAVRVASDHRSAGLGAQLIAHAEALARAAGAGMIQLTTDRSRTRAHRFYERLGYEQSHLGYKKLL